MFRIAGGMFFVGAVSVVVNLNRIDSEIFLELYCGSEQLGIYASVAVPTLIVQMGAAYFFNPMITVFAELWYIFEKRCGSGI